MSERSERTIDMATFVERSCLVELLAGDWLVAVLVAPPGYGKSVLVHQWVERSSARVLEVSLDGLRDEAAAERLRHAIETTAGASGADEPVTLVVDCPQPLDGPESWDVVIDVVERRPPRLRVVVMCQVDPLLPITRWCAQGIALVLREDCLRFDDREALEIAAARRPGLSRSAAVELNRLVEGWPIAFTLALMAIDDDWSAGGPHPALLVDALVAAVVDGLPPGHRAAALALAAFEWFDEALASAVIGQAARPVLAELRRRHLVEPVEPGVGLRFNGLVRQILDAELRWRDPQRHADLHRQAAEHWLANGHWSAAYGHVAAVRDAAAVRDLVVDPAVALFDAGDRVGLARMHAALPRPSAIDDAAVALDLATVSLLAGDLWGARRWVERAESIGEPGAPPARIHATLAAVGILEGRLDEAAHHVASFVRHRPGTSPEGPWRGASDSRQRGWR